MHINPPGGLASGHQGLADKVAREVYKSHLQLPPDFDLREDSDSYRGNTSDLGTEVGLPGFVLKNGDPAEMLPRWVERGSLARDVEVAEASDDGGSNLNMPLDIDVGDNDNNLGGGNLDIPLDIDAGDNDNNLVGMEQDAPAESAEEACLPNASSNQYLRNGYRIAGVQHLSDNANSDSNRSMPHWDQFHRDLKLLESFVDEEHRRQRYIWTCLRRTRFSHFAKKFETFSASLYEARWHEVVKFLKQIRTILVILCDTFDYQRYNAGVDADGAHVPEIVETRNRQERLRGRVAWDPARLQEILRSGFFHLYVEVTFFVDNAPTKWAREMELCPCHRALFVHLNLYQIELVLAAHFGPSIRSCPMAGKNIPEMVAYGCTEFFNDLLARRERRLQLFRPPPRTTPVTRPQWDIALAAFRQGARAGLMLMQVKLDYIKRVPVAFAGGAVADESSARASLVKARDNFRMDPREAAHDPRTWRLMHPGSIFSRELDRFIDLEMPRDALHMIFQFEIAVFRGLMATETVIEARHALASLALKQHWQGVVRFSLANRLPMMGRWLERGVVTGEELLEAFAQCIKLLRMPDLFGTALHPRLADVTHPNQIRAEYPKVFYHCDIEAMFTSQKEATKANQASKAATTRASAKLILGGNKQPATSLDYTSVVRYAMTDHLRHSFNVSGSSKVHSTRSNALDIVNLEGTLNEPRTKRSRVDGGVGVDTMALDADVEASAGSFTHRNIFFEVVWQNLGKKRRIPVAIGAGQQLANYDCGVYVHTTTAEDDDAEIVVMERDDASLQANFIIRGLADNCSIDDFKEGTLTWSKTSRWMIDCVGCRAPEISNLLEMMIDQDALFDRPKAGGFKATSGTELQSLGILLDRGFVEETHGRWFLTRSGWEHSRSSTVAITPLPVFHVEDRR